jgi:hypothetical protein
VVKFLVKDALWETEDFPLSNNTINRCIDYLSYDAEEDFSWWTGKKQFFYSDWWGDRGHKCKLCYTRFVIDVQIQETFLSFKELTETRNNWYFVFMPEKNACLWGIVKVTVLWCPLDGSNKCFDSLIRKGKNPNVAITHWFSL